MTDSADDLEAAIRRIEGVDDLYPGRRGPLDPTTLISQDEKIRTFIEAGSSVASVRVGVQLSASAPSTARLIADVLRRSHSDAQIRIEVAHLAEGRTTSDSAVHPEDSPDS